MSSNRYDRETADRHGIKLGPHEEVYYVGQPEFTPVDPWVCRSAGMRCKTCMWFVEKSPNSILAPEVEPPVVGRCRRHAPSMNGYPVVYATDWCGDHKLDENKI